MTNETYESPQANISLDLREFALLLWDWAWLILLAGVIAGGIAYYLTSRDAPVYTASTTLLVSEPPTARPADTSQSAMVPSNLMAQTYAQMLKNLPVLQEVVQRLQIPLSPIALKSMISVTLIQNTQLIQATVTDTDPQRATAIANTLGGVFAEQIQNLQSVRYAQSKASLTQQISEMETQLQQVSDQFTNATDPLEKSQLDTKQTQYRLIYSNLVTSFEQLRIAEAQSATIVAQVDPAVVSRLPVGQNSSQNIILVAFIGMLLAAGVIFVANLLDDTVRSPEELNSQLGLPILGAIPHHSVHETTPITQEQPYSSISEAYRALRTNVEHVHREHNLQRILVASPLPEEGKTTVVSNLAVILAQRGLHTILLDGDMRWPRAHRALGLQNRSGLSSLFLQSDGDQNVNIQATQLKNLSLVSSGPLPPNPAEMLGSPRMTSILEWLNQQSDIILIDTPPALTVTDASALALQVDGILIVVKAGKTKLNSVRRLVTTLRQQGANLLGIVVNDIKFNNKRNSYYYRDYYTNSARLRSEDGKKKTPKQQAPAKSR
jgi:polysaccharide biosynthesis transport protein